MTTHQHVAGWGLDSLCVCGHRLGSHCASPREGCLFYSFPERTHAGEPGENNPRCGCQSFEPAQKPILRVKRRRKA